MSAFFSSMDTLSEDTEDTEDTLSKDTLSEDTEDTLSEDTLSEDTEDTEDTLLFSKGIRICSISVL